MTPEHEDDEGSTYCVKEGDTLVGIALRHRMKVSDLKYLNHMFGSDVYKGQILQIKARKRTRSLSLPPNQFPNFESRGNSDSSSRRNLPLYVETNARIVFFVH